MMNIKQRFPTWMILAAVAAWLVPAAPASAVPIIFTDEAAWEAAVLSIDAGADLRLEDFNAAPTGDLGAGPSAFGGGDFSIGLQNIGNGGSFTGIINPGENDGSNAFGGRVVLDSSDFELFPGFTVLGEGVESIDFGFTDAVIGFGGQWNSTTTNDGVQINVNGVQVDLIDFLPTNTLVDGDGFLGIVDTAGIGAFSLVSADRDPGSAFEDFELDDFRYALSGAAPTPVPEPGTLGLLALGGIGLVMGRRRRRD